jgi:hypothetical protein
MLARYGCKFSAEDPTISHVRGLPCSFTAGSSIISGQWAGAGSRFQEFELCYAEPSPPFLTR